MIISQTSTLNAVTKFIDPTLQQQNQISSIITDITNIRTAINGNVTFNDNISGQFITFSTTTANVSNIISHNLGAIPIGFIVTNINVGGVVYTNTLSSWTLSSITLFCNVANATVTVFLLLGG